MKENIEEISKESFDEWLMMGLDLWPDNTETGLRESFLELLDMEKEKAFIYKINDEYAGFINVSIRSDYVEGSSTSPVGYVEGIYVKPIYRRKGIAEKLIKRGEEWARSKGCTQMGSDIEMNNTVSYSFHRGAGFTEANRIICFIKDIV